MGGEKQTPDGTGHGKPGSPPRGRGKVEGVPEVRPGHRITPAWAGKSHLGAVLIVAGEDHPRVGGEKRFSRVSFALSSGSPPRGRGKATFYPLVSLGLGITPAWAGKSVRSEHGRPRLWDHPRVGGEKRRLSECAQWAEGSPPRGRGKENQLNPQNHPKRITPAWAGKSDELRSVFVHVGDHPRVGGEKLAI